jgi:type IV secretory pathway VirB4 component
LSDVETSSISSTLIESCPTRIFLPNDRAREQGQTDIYRRFGLNNRQIDILAQAQPKQDYYYTSPLGARLFDLGLGPIALSVCASASPGDQALLDKCLGLSGRDALIGEYLRRKDLGWAADLLGAWPGPDETSSSPSKASSD